MNSLPGFILQLLLVLLALLGIAGENGPLTVLAVVVLGLGFYLLFRPGVSPILLFIFGYQWLQASTKIFQGNFLGVPIDSLSMFGGDVAGATFLSLISLLFLVFGLRLGAGPGAGDEPKLLRADASGKPLLYWFNLYLLAFLIALGMSFLSNLVPGMRIPFLALASLKWAFYWAFTFATFSQDSGPKRLWLLVFLLELIMGSVSYFSDFKTILFFTLLAMLPAGVRLSPVRVMGLLALAALTLVLGVVWTAIKTDYRDFLSQGERAQVVSVSHEESFSSLLTLVGDLDGFSLKTAAMDMAERVSYVDIFARAVDYVPATKPYQYGAVWGDAIRRPFMPRLFFSEKTAIDDSNFTNEFTGLSFGNNDSGTSVSIGYIGESYIDFGAFFMMTPIFMLGLGLGIYYKWISSYPAVGGLLSSGLATATLYPVAQLETSITKLIGGLVISMLMAWILAHWGLPYIRRFEK